MCQDCPLLQISYDDWRVVQDPKVKGTWNLHNALSEANLDFFILLSSISGAVGHPGQANYASANSFLGSFTQYRHSLGLPCSVIDLAGVEGIGYLSDRPAKLQQYRSSSLFMLQEQHLVDAIQISMRRSIPADDVGPTVPRSPFTNMSHLAVGLRSTKPLSDGTNRLLFKGDVRISLHHNMESADQTSAEPTDEGLRELLSQVEANPEVLNEASTLERASWEIGRTLFGFLLLPEENLDVNMTLASIGVDSLVSIEIRNWWRKTLRSDITVLEIVNAGTIKGLGKLAISSLQERYGVKQDANGETIGGADSSEAAAAAVASEDETDG